MSGAAPLGAHREADGAARLAGWNEAPGPDAARGRDDFVELPWERALDLLAAELARVRDAHGPSTIFGGSYGCSSAGRFHHAQSQVHRFLNTVLGGYVRSANFYSAGVSAVIMPHMVVPMESASRRNVTWEAVAEHSAIVLAFGSMALKNSAVASGGMSRRVERGTMAKAAARGCELMLVGPPRGDMPVEARAEWLPIRSSTGTALTKPALDMLRARAS